MPMAADIDAQIEELRRRLAALDEERHLIAERLRDIVSLRERLRVGAGSDLSEPLTGSITSSSPANEEISIFRRLFRGREGVFPRRWPESEDRQGRLRAGVS